MDDIDAFHASHIGRVKVDFCLSARDLDPEAVSQVTGLQPDRTAKRGDERRNYKGDLLTPHDEGFWLISSAKRVQSKDVNVHLKSLLTELLPHQKLILQIVAELKGNILRRLMDVQLSLRGYWSVALAGSRPRNQ